MDEATNEAIELLEEASDTLDDAITLVRRAYAAIPDGARAERVRQIAAQLEMALGDDHEWLGGSSYTIQNSLNELRELDDDELEQYS